MNADVQSIHVIMTFTVTSTNLQSNPIFAVQLIFRGLSSTLTFDAGPSFKAFLKSWNLANTSSDVVWAGLLPNKNPQKWKHPTVGACDLVRHETSPENAEVTWETINDWVAHRKRTLLSNRSLRMIPTHFSWMIKVSFIVQSTSSLTLSSKPQVHRWI